MKLLLLIFGLSFSLSAAEYQKPDIDFPTTAKVKKAKVKKEKWNSESHYKIDEKFVQEAARDVASEAEISRDPSSIEEKDESPKSLEYHELRPWIYKHPKATDSVE